jgi:hypothetical protein
VSIYLQRAVRNAGSTAAATHTYASTQTAGNTNVVAVWVASTRTVTGVTDTRGNTYVSQGTITNGIGETLSIWVALNIAASTAGTNVVTVALNSAHFVDLAILEYPACTSVRTQNTRQQIGGTAVRPQVQLSGTQSGDIVFGLAATSNFTLSGASGAVGANAAQNAADDSISTSGGTTDKWLCIEGLSDGTGPLVTFGTTNDDYYGAVATALVPTAGGGGTTYNPTIGTDAIDTVDSGQWDLYRAADALLVSDSAVAVRSRYIDVMMGRRQFID